MSANISLTGYSKVSDPCIHPSMLSYKGWFYLPYTVILHGVDSQLTIRIMSVGKVSCAVVVGHS